MFHIKRVYINYLFTTMQKEFLTGLKLRNSLSNQLVTFLSYSVIICPHGQQHRQVVHLWTHRLLQQSHGPRQVIYFSYFRNYLCNDMIRRVLRDHFGYNIQYCMNITDVDDKIINRSND